MPIEKAIYRVIRHLKIVCWIAALPHLWEGDAFRNPIMQALAGNSTRLRADVAKWFASRRLPSLTELSVTDRAARPVRAASGKRAARDCHASAGGHASRDDPNVCSGNSDGRDTSNRHDH